MKYEEELIQFHLKKCLNIPFSILDKKSILSFVILIEKIVSTKTTNQQISEYNKIVIKRKKCKKKNLYEEY